ncbi:hypothetical protein K1T71_008465 [Dendrolimus kikuchii]|uniref:Uncharacterized protein n=1 Tax=Dendrolimus kikuchii TaxID=765133 RepID=A0ACC1CXG9_9NEOP|nr:hypothetical protein K1T71_008465 [Dendrolimus kikuchii]
MQNPQIIHISHSSLPTAQGKVTYQQSIATESLHMPVTSNTIESQIIPQNQIVMSCQHNLQTLQPIQGQVLQSSEISQPLQVFLPQCPVFKQHMIVNGVHHQYYRHYEYAKEACLITKLDAVKPVVTETVEECNLQKIEKPQSESDSRKKHPRSHIPNPTMWACNVRKQKHQKGEAYISRRGKYVPERKVKTTKDCLNTCKYKCNEHITDSDREHLFKAFYSLSTNEKKHFLLNTTERNSIKPGKVTSNHKRKYSFKYFFLVRAVKYTVCKNFYLGTLSISQKPVYNVHMGKSDMNIPKPDGRGLSEASTHSLPSESKEKVRKHITSFKTVKDKPVKQFSKKKQYLQSNLNIKQMYTMYLSACSTDNVVPVKESMYRKILKQEFNLHFVKVKEQMLCAKCKCAIKE